jgi:hypothetical protein
MQKITTFIETENLTMVSDRPEVIEQAAQHLAETPETVTVIAQLGVDKMGEIARVE